MLIIHNKICLKNYFGLISIAFILVFIACQSKKTNQDVQKTKDLTDQLSANASMETIADHLIKVRKAAGTTRALALYYPDLDEDTAYKIQMTMLSKLEKQGERVAGWKMGGAKVTDPSKPFKPLFGFMLASLEVKSGGTADHKRYTDGAPLIEAEVGFLIGKDLPGPDVSREELLNAIAGVGGFSELISIRVRGVDGGIKSTTAQGIADGAANGGFIQPQHKYPLDQIDLSKVEAKVLINGEVKATGNSKDYKFIDAVLYLANSLPKYGRYLHTGDVVITGSLLTPPPAKAGDKVKIEFSAFDPLSVTFK